MSPKDYQEKPEEILGRAPAEEAALFHELNEIGSEIVQRLDDERQDKREPRDRSDINYASELGHPCAKHLVYARLNWKEREPMDVDGAYRVEEGNRAEWWLTKDLGDIGFKVNEAQRSFGIPELQLRGRVDGLLPLNRVVKSASSFAQVPVEMKTINPNYWETTRTVEAIRRHRGWWIRGYPSQLNAYLYASSTPFGFFILKTFGKKPRVLPMIKNPDLWSADVAKLQLVNAHVAAGTYPEPIPFEDQVCGMCDWAHLCQPLRATGFQTVDPFDEPLLEEYLELKKWSKRFEEAKAGLIGTKDKPGKYWGINGVLLDIVISSRTQQRTMYDVPADVKAPFGRKQDVNITTIERII